MTTYQVTEDPQDSALDRLLATQIRVDWEILGYAILIILAIITRFYALDTRVMSHDESLHTYFAWQLAEGDGFAHTPLMHGPLQFHLIALSYFLFGDSDATARIPVALAGILSVGMMYFYRRWLGRAGALMAAALLVFSPFMLYYSRYVRNEALVVFLVLIGLYAVFRYFEDRQARWLYIYSGVLALHVAAKETSFIYTGQLLLFIGILFAARALARPWSASWRKFAFVGGVVSAALGGGVILLSLFQPETSGLLGQSETLEPLEPLDPSAVVEGGTTLLSPLGTLGLVLLLAGIFLFTLILLLEFGKRLRAEFASFDLLLITVTLTLPQLAAVPANMLGWDPLAYEDSQSILYTGIAATALLAISVAIGVLWNWKRWLISAGIFFGIFAVLYTTVFTNSDGFVSGLVGSLGYWIEQHGVQRGSQPWYYYAFIQIPFYEFLPAIGALIAMIYGAYSWIRGDDPDESNGDLEQSEPGRGDVPSSFPHILFLAYWTLTSLIAFSFAGERMPWLTVHIALPMILLTGWVVGKYLESIDWSPFREGKAWLIAGLTLLTILASIRAIGALLGPSPPLVGTQLVELRQTMGFILALVVAVGAFIGLAYVARGWKGRDLAKLGGLIGLSLLFFLTVRTSLRASFINYDNATEYMVYAHSATGVKTIMDQLEELSVRTTDSLAIDVGYDDDVSWPFSWYLRNYPQRHYFAANPGRDIQNYPVIITGDNNWSKVEPILGDNYQSFEYIRMWWPMQDYFDLNQDRLASAFVSAEMRGALWDIWLNRDYQAYGEVTGKDFALQNWSPSDRMKLYIRNDIAAQIWDYGVSPAVFQEEVEFVDPYVDGMLDLNAIRILDPSAVDPLDLLEPRDMAVAEDGSIFIADSRNHRILKLNEEGEIITAWGQFADIAVGEAPGGTFNEPWGVAVAPDGTVLVADTWNHRIQRFTDDGEFLGMFGSFGQAETPQSFWGPRDVAVGPNGNIFVSDTGNKRVAIFDTNGQWLGEFGGPGLGEGQFDESVGLAIGENGNVYVADTWNQRIQVFEARDGVNYFYTGEWPIEGWFGQSLNNKPYLAVGSEGQVCTSDPEGYRILCFNSDGEFLSGWGSFGSSINQLGLPMGLAFGEDGNMWVVDSANNRLMLFDTDSISH